MNDLPFENRTHRSRRPRLLLWLPLLAVAFYLGVSWRAGISSSHAAPRAIDDGALNAVEQATIELFRQASPSVCYITTLTRRRIAFTRYTKEVPTGSGSGFVWDQDGHIVTNLHVVAQGKPRVTLSDQSEWDAEVVGYAADKDLAVLRIKAPRDELEPIRIGRSRDLLVGQSVFAIGNPFGLDHTLTTGVVSAVGREIMSLDRRPIRDVIQTDAAINPGNSGGPLLDSSGRLIGVNTQIYSPSGASAGIGFAIPVDTVNWVVPDLISHGEIRRPQIGISDAGGFTLRLANGQRVRGVLFFGLSPGSGAERAGLKPSGSRRDEIGDVIIGIDNERIENMDDLMLALEEYRGGDTATLNVLRDGEEIEVPVELTSRRGRR